jgi:hypothetical protein
MANSRPVFVKDLHRDDFICDKDGLRIRRQDANNSSATNTDNEQGFGVQEIGTHLTEKLQKGRL